MLSLRLLMAGIGGGAFTIPGDDVALGWFNVKTYGAAGDGTTDDTSAVASAVAALNAAGAGVLYFPHGSYKTSGGFTLSAPFLVLGDGKGDFNNGAVVSQVSCTSSTASLFTVTADIGRFEKIALENTSGSTPSAGAGVTVLGSGYAGTQVDFEGVQVRKFWINVDVQVSSEWSMHASRLMGPVKYALKVRNTVNADWGDWSVSGCTLNAGYHSADAAIRIESSGGGRITDCKFNAAGSIDATAYARCIDYLGSGDTGVMVVSACSFENYSGDAIHLDANGHTYKWVSITGCEFGQYGNGSGVAIYTTGIDGVSISGCVFAADTGTPTAISLNSGTQGYVGPVVESGFGTRLATSSFTNLIDHNNS